MTGGQKQALIYGALVLFFFLFLGGYFLDWTSLNKLLALCCLKSKCYNVIVSFPMIASGLSRILFYISLLIISCWICRTVNANQILSERLHLNIINRFFISFVDHLFSVCVDLTTNQGAMKLTSDLVVFAAQYALVPEQISSWGLLAAAIFLIGKVSKDFLLHDQEACHRERPILCVSYS